ncbi:MAG: M2 family metallopeptidase [Myxococcales bacterium]|nr:M2 family metallopeptidase [Myxococcales bacterium]
MQTTYFRGVCDRECRGADHFLDILHTAKDPVALRDAWLAWHDGVGRPERPLFENFVPLANAGARAAGFRDVGEMWRSAYDEPPDQFLVETERMWASVSPLYQELHCYVRRKLHTKYGELVPAHGVIPTQLTRDLYSLNWNQLWPEVVPYPDAAPIDVSEALVAQHYDPLRMVKTGEAFFESLGMEPLPATFWDRSVFAKPEGKVMSCPGQRVWNIDGPADVRMTMCVEPTHEHLWIIYHELGHAHYHWAMRHLPLLLQQAANPGFDEASGDVLQLSMTPAYLHAIGLLPTAATSQEATINALMHLALDKVAFLPYGYLVDKWRWEVFSGKTTPGDYNTRWWQLKAQYQGVGPAAPRATTDFDPGVQGHLALNFPYMSYFIAGIVQFQLHRALCKKAGFSGPLHECSIYGSKAAGAAYERLFRLGASKPWQDALEELSGERQIDADALIEYFAPLQAWLKEQNRGHACGW